MSVKSNSISLVQPRFASGAAIGKRKPIGKSEQEDNSGRKRSFREGPKETRTACSSPQQ